jgi:glycosyltransferase involved in cell wall biosynthesis
MISIVGVLDGPAIGGVLTYSLLLSELLQSEDLVYRIASPNSMPRDSAELIAAAGIDVVTPETLDRLDVDVLHVHHYKSHLRGIGHSIRKRRRVPILATLHGAQIVRPGARALVARRLDDLLKNCCSNALIAVAPKSEDNRWLFREIDLVIPNAGPAPACCERFGVPGKRSTSSGPLRVAFVGRFYPEKGPDRLVDLARALAVQVGSGNFTMVLWGTGPMLPQVRHDLSKLTSVSTFSGMVDWSTIDVLAIPSRQEGSPMVIAEALAHGCPVVSTDAADHGDWSLTPGIAFVYWDPRTFAGQLVELGRSEHHCAGAILESRRRLMSLEYSNAFRKLAAGQ